MMSETKETMMIPRTSRDSFTEAVSSAASEILDRATVRGETIDEAFEGWKSESTFGPALRDRVYDDLLRGTGRYAVKCDDCKRELRRPR